MKSPISSEFDTMWRRFGALCIDAGILYLAQMIAMFVLIPVMYVFRSTSVTTVSMAYLLVPIYFVVTESRFGGTVGKRLTGLTVLGQTGMRPTLSMVLKRYLWLIVYFGSIPVMYRLAYRIDDTIAMLLFWSYGLAPILWLGFEIHHALSDPRRRALHDAYAGTVVRFRGFKEAEPGATDNPGNA